MSCLPGICTISLGRAAAGHTLTDKLDMASKFGFKGVELFHEDLISIAQKKRDESEPHTSESTRQPRLDTTGTKPFTPTEELAAAHEIRIMCRQRGLSIICLQPFWQYEGLLDRAEHKRQLTEKLPLWFQLCQALDTDMIQVPSNFLPSDQLCTDPKVAIQDLRDMADAGLAAFGDSDPVAIVRTGDDRATDGNKISNHDHKTTSARPIRFAYEALAWGTKTSTWESAYASVLAVDRPNFGLLLDTFNIAGSAVFADPASPTGMVDEADGRLTASLDKLVQEVDVSKVFYVQIAGAERLAQPLVQGHALWDIEQNVRMSWSRSCRLFYGEEGMFLEEEEEERDRETILDDVGLRFGGSEESRRSVGPSEEYLPISRICGAIFNDLGFRGWVSMEIFHRETWNASNPNVPHEFAQRGMVGWEKLKNEFGLDNSGSAKLDCGCGCGDEIGSGAVTESGSISGSESE